MRIRYIDANTHRCRHSIRVLFAEVVSGTGFGDRTGGREGEGEGEDDREGEGEGEGVSECVCDDDAWSVCSFPTYVCMCVCVYVRV